MATKGIILAGGAGTRLYPLTHVVSKQLLPVYDKPMIYYPLSVLMLAGIRDILVISTPTELPRFKELLKDGSQWGVSFTFIEQPTPNGLPQAFVLGEEFIGKDSVCLILGDNIFYGNGLVDMLQRASNQPDRGTIFAYYVQNPQAYGVVEFDKDKKVKSLEEKPKNPKSHYAVTGLYFFDNNVSQIARALKPSARGETEITDVMKAYLAEKKLDVEIFRRGMAWLDTGSHETLLQASQFIATIEARQGLKVCCPEEIAFRMKFISAEQLEKLAASLKQNAYGQYLLEILRADTLD